MDIHNIILSLASNCQQQENLAKAQKRLDQVLFDLNYTQIIWNKPYKCSTSESDNHSNDEITSPLYVNQLLYARTTLTIDELNTTLKQIEQEMGRTPQAKSLGIVPIDLDLMKYDTTRYHLDDWERPYIKNLLSDYSLQRLPFVPPTDCTDDLQ